jgi:hypothetical protein
VQLPEGNGHLARLHACRKVAKLIGKRPRKRRRSIGVAFESFERSCEVPIKPRHGGPEVVICADSGQREAAIIAHACAVPQDVEGILHRAGEALVCADGPDQRCVARRSSLKFIMQPFVAGCIFPSPLLERP